jgi:hypothetical protein
MQVTTSKRSGAGDDLDAEPETESGNVKGEKRKVDGWVTVRKIQKLRREVKTKWNFEKQKGSQRTSERERERA